MRSIPINAPDVCFAFDAVPLLRLPATQNNRITLIRKNASVAVIASIAANSERLRKYKKEGNSNEKCKFDNR